MLEKNFIVGLGNPGKQYEWTRHNLGFLVVQHLAKKYHLKFSVDSRIKGWIAEGEVEEKKVYLFLPQTYVNQSGVAVEEALLEKKITLENILVVNDDFNLAFGELRLRPEGSDGGHNGLTSIIEHLKTNQFCRLRLGIGAPIDKKQAVDFVLGEFTKKERQELAFFLELATECCVVWIKEGVGKAMSQFNKRKSV